MPLHPLAKKSLVTGTILLALAVLIGAFGAHGLKNLVPSEKLVTFETGVRYHFYHAFGLIVVGLIQQQFQNIKMTKSYWCFLLGVLIFSFDCYLYVLSGMKVFAMIVPVGGLLFAIGWVLTTVQLLKLR
jgi:uncharacterized membrane protein YgdD (TMEM256/DUF423 family)